MLLILYNIVYSCKKRMNKSYHQYHNLDQTENPHFDITQWESVKNTTTPKLYYNKITRLHCEEYLIQKATQKDRQNYEKRKLARDQHVVNIYDCESFANYNNYGTFLNYSIRIYLQHIKHRISQIHQLEFNKLLKYLFQTLKGFFRIFQQYQPVRVTPQMIGINQNDQIKVWLSQDHRENYVHVGQYLNQKIMVKDIFSIFNNFGMQSEQRQKGIGFIEAILYVESKINQIKYQPLFTNPPSQSQLNYIRRKTLVNQTRMSETPQLKRIVSYQQNKQRPISMIYNPQEMVEYGQMGYKPFEKKKQNKRYFEASQDIQNNGKEGLAMSIQSVRTTSKTILANKNIIQLDQNQLPYELLDEKKSKQFRLQIIEQLLRRSKQRPQQYSLNIRKICIIFRHALKFDPVMLKEIQKVRGKLSQIRNQYMVNRILSVCQQQNQQIGTQEMTSDKIKMILQQQRLKRNKFSISQSMQLKNIPTPKIQETKKGKNGKNLQLFKEQVEKLLFD